MNAKGENHLCHHLANPCPVCYTSLRSCKFGSSRDLVHERCLHMPEVQSLLTSLAFGESPRWHDGRL